MKHTCILAVLAASALSLANCASEPPIEHHYYHNTTYYRERPSQPSYRYNKPAGVSGGSYSSSPEGFQAITPPHSYSQ